MRDLASTNRLVLLGYLPLHWLLTGWWTLGAVVLAVEAWRATSFTLPVRLARVLCWLILAGSTVWLGLQVWGMVKSGFAGGLRQAGFAYHPNALGSSMAAMVVLLAVIADRFSEARMVALILGVVSTALLVASGSRSLILGLAVGAVLGLVLLGRLLPRRLLLPVGVAGFLLLAAGLLLVGQFIRSGGLLGSFERAPLYSVALELASTSPWTGVGQNQWADNVYLIEPSFPEGHAPHEHSAFMRLLLEGGTIGFVLVLVSVINWSISLGDRRMWTSSWSQLACIMAVAALAAQALVDVTLLQSVTYIPLFLACLFFMNAAADKSGTGRNKAS